MRLVVSIVPARVEVHLRGRGIDTMWRRSFTQRPGQHVVCFVVLIVVPWDVFGFSAPRSRAGGFSSTSSLRRLRSTGGRVVAVAHYPRD